jgi:hypothetical protein
MTLHTELAEAPTAIDFSVPLAGRELVPVLRAPTLEDLVGEINRHIDMSLKAESSANSHRLRAGQHLIEARKLVPAREWQAWCAANIKRGHRDVQRLMKISGAEAPEAALKQERAKARVGMRRQERRRLTFVA